LTCTCGHDGSKHAWIEPTVCKEIHCNCIKFVQVTEYTPLISNIDKYMIEFEKIRDRMRWVLEHWKWFRNYNNKDLVFGWWEYVNHWNKHTALPDEQYKKLDEPESITRARRWLVEHNPELYAPFIPNYEEQKIFKQYAITEWVVANK